MPRPAGAVTTAATGPSHTCNCKLRRGYYAAVQFVDDAVGNGIYIHIHVYCRGALDHAHVPIGTLFYTWHVHLPLAPSVLPTACIPAPYCTYLLQHTHTVMTQSDCKQASRSQHHTVHISCKHTQSDGKPVGHATEVIIRRSISMPAAMKPTGNQGHVCRYKAVARTPLPSR